MNIRSIFLNKVAMVFVMFILLIPCFFSTAVTTNGLDPNTGLVTCGNDTSGSMTGNEGVIKSTDQCNFEKLLLMINGIIDFAFWIVSFVLIGVIAYSGFMFIVSAGNSSKVAESKKRLWSILWGLIWMLCAWLLVYTIQHTLLKPEFYSSLLTK